MRSVESTALRVLRAPGGGRREEPRQPPSPCKVASDVAIYTLNQKRRELARIETEYGMEITFEPKEGLMAGNFELERTRSRDPGERPRNPRGRHRGGLCALRRAGSRCRSSKKSRRKRSKRAERQCRAKPKSETAGTRRAGDRAAANARRRPPQRRRRGGRGRNRDRDGVRSAPRPAEGASRAGRSGDGEADIVRRRQPDMRRKRTGHEHGRSRPDNGQQWARMANRAAAAAAAVAAVADATGSVDGDRPGTVSQTGFANEADRFGAVPDEIDTTPHRRASARTRRARPRRRSGR